MLSNIKVKVGGNVVKNRLQVIRLSLGYKFQKGFSEFLQINQNQYCRYENNTTQPSLEILFNIAEKLNCKIDDIVYKPNV